MKTTLILIDIQNDYFPGGRMELEGPLEAATQARHLLNLFREHEWHTLHIQHISTRPGATFFLPETSGIDFHPSIKPMPGEPVLVKHFPNSFRGNGIFGYIEDMGHRAAGHLRHDDPHVCGCHHPRRRRPGFSGTAGRQRLRHPRADLWRNKDPRLAGAGRLPGGPQILRAGAPEQRDQRQADRGSQ